MYLPVRERNQKTLWLHPKLSLFFFKSSYYLKWATEKKRWFWVESKVYSSSRGDAGYTWPQEWWSEGKRHRPRQNRETPRWQAAVHGLTRSRTRLSHSCWYYWWPARLSLQAQRPCHASFSIWADLVHLVIWLPHSLFRASLNGFLISAFRGS